MLANNQRGYIDEYEWGICDKITLYSAHLSSSFFIPCVLRETLKLIFLYSRQLYTYEMKIECALDNKNNVRNDENSYQQFATIHHIHTGGEMIFSFNTFFLFFFLFFSRSPSLTPPLSLSCSLARSRLSFTLSRQVELVNNYESLKCLFSTRLDFRMICIYVQRGEEEKIYFRIWNILTLFSQSQFLAFFFSHFAKIS